MRPVSNNQSISNICLLNFVFFLLSLLGDDVEEEISEDGLLGFLWILID